MYDSKDSEIKVAYFTHASNLTGANRSLLDLTSSLKEKGVVPVVFLRENGPIEQELERKGIKYYILPYKTWFRSLQSDVTLKNRIRNVLKERYNARLARKTSKILQDEEVQLIHSNTLIIGFGSQVAKVANLPHIWHIREFMEEDHQLTFYNEKKAAQSLKQATALVAISDVIATKFSKRLGREVEIIYNGVNIKKYSIPNKLILAQPRTELMVVGRISETKGQMEALKAIELLKEKNYDIHLRIIGDALKEEEEKKIQTYITEHHLDGAIDHVPFQKDLSPYSKSCDIQLVCSHSEAFGRVTVEGMLTHSLVIGADAGCTPYLIKDGETGLLYTCKDPRSLANKIEWALSHKEEAQVIADAGYIEGLHFSIDTTAQSVLQLYTKILSET